MDEPRGAVDQSGCHLHVGHRVWKDPDNVATSSRSFTLYGLSTLAMAKSSIRLYIWSRAIRLMGIRTKTRTDTFAIPRLELSRASTEGWGLPLTAAGKK